MTEENKSEAQHIDPNVILIMSQSVNVFLPQFFPADSVGINCSKYGFHSLWSGISTAISRATDTHVLHFRPNWLFSTG